MPIDDIRAKQKADQTKAIKSRLEAGSIVRIGNRIPITGRYEVLETDGGIFNNGVKVYNAQEQYGDRVLAYPRLDGTIALDSEKGSIVRPPTAFPVCPGYLKGQVFNCEEPKRKRPAKIWILYFFAGKLWVGGHQEQPEEVGSVYFGGPIALSEENGGPGLILSIGNSSNLHVWGDVAGWVATYQTFPPNFDSTNATTFHSVTSTTRKKYSTSFGFNESGTAGGYNADGIDNNERSFPLGAGFVSYRSMRDISSVNPEGSLTLQNYSTTHQVTIGYLENAVPTFHQFSSGESYLAKLYDGLVINEMVAYSGTIPVPNLDGQTILPYSGRFSCPEGYEYDKGPYFNNERPQRVVVPTVTGQSVHNYAILCDRGVTYYIQESISFNASPSFNASSSIQKVYELRSTDSPVVIATNTTEPRFFGIRWDIRASAFTEGAWREFLGATSASYNYGGYAYSKYSDPAYFYPTYAFNATGQAHSLPVGRFKTVNNNVLSFDEYQFYPYFVTFSGGQVVTVELSEINKAKNGGAELQRRSVSVDGTFSDLGTIFCHPIPATAIIYHWSTTA